MSKKIPQEHILSIIGWLSRTPFIDKYKLRKPLEKLIYKISRHTFATFKKRTLEPSQQENDFSKNKRFNLNLSDEQEMLVSMVKDFSKNIIRPAAFEANELESLSKELSASIDELDVLQFVVPENYGGAATDQSPITQFLLTESLAYGDLSIASASLSTLSFANVISRFGSESQKQHWFKTLIDTETPLQASLAIMEPCVNFNPFKLETQAKKIGKYYQISGKKSLVMNQQNSGVFLIAAKDKYGTGLYIIPRNTQGFTVKSASAMGLKAADLGQLKLNKVKVPLENRIGELEFKAEDYEHFISLSRLAICALATGCCQAVLEESISYANQREAFGEPISHRQSVAFMIADMGTELEGMRLMALRGAAKAEHQLDFNNEAFLAKFQCGNKAMQIGSDGVQIFGGHGFTKEYPVERWYRDLRAISMLEGSLLL